MSALPWPRMIALAAGLGVPPPAFWGLSVREWRALAAPESGLQALGADGLARLSDLFPDEPTQEEVANGRDG